MLAKTIWYPSFLKFLRREKVSKREKNLWYCMAGKVENKNLRGIWKWELLLALVIGQAALSLVIASVSRTKRNRIKKRKKSLILHGWESREQKIEEYENGNNYLLWRSDKRRFPYNYCLGLSDEDNSVSRTDNFVNVNVFNSVTSPRVLSYRCVLHYFLTMPVGFY